MKISVNIFILVMLIIVYSISSPFTVLASVSYGYTYTIGGSGWDKGEDVASDSSGNIYFTGFFRGANVDFNTTGSGSPDLKSSVGITWQDIFLTKINSDGSYGYTYTFGGSGQDSPDGIATDSSGNVFLTGNFSGTDVDFNTTGSGSPDLKSSTAGSMDIFITKINADGSYGYTYTIGGTTGDWGASVAADSSGNVYFTGFFQGSNVDFNTTGSGSPDLKTATAGDIFLIKINSDGSYGYTYTIGGSNQDLGNGITTDSSDNVYLTGTFRETNVDFNTTGSGSPDIKNSAGLADIFITKINSDGSYGYTYTIGGSESDMPYGITADPSGNVYSTGYFQGTNIDFNTTGAGSPDLKSSVGVQDIFITKINSDGSYGYTYSIGSTSEDVGYDLDTDTSGNVYMTGYFQGTDVNFNTTGSGSADLKTGFIGNVFITKLNADGSYGYTYTLGGSALDRGFGISWADPGNIYVVGDFWSTSVDFDPTSGEDTKTSDGSDDIFFMQMVDPLPTPTPTPTPISTPTATPTPTPTTTPEDHFDICHFPPGNSAATHVINIPLSAWNGHSNHPGDFIMAAGDECPPTTENNPECPSDMKYCSHSGPTSTQSMHIVNGNSILGDALTMITKDASAHDIHITINSKSKADLINENIRLPEDQKLLRVSEIFNFQSLSSFNGYPIAEFDKPVTIILPYDPYLFMGKNAERIRIAFYDKQTKKWKIMVKNTVLHQFNHTVANTTRNFSYFTVVYY